MRRPRRNLHNPPHDETLRLPVLRSPGSLSKPVNLGFLAAAGSSLFEDPIEFPQVFFRRIFGKLGFRGFELSVERHLAVQFNHMAEPGANILGGRIRLHKPLPKPLELGIYLLKERPEALACQLVTQNGCVKARLKSGARTTVTLFRGPERSRFSRHRHGSRPMSLKDKTIVVTGGSRGLGLGLVEALVDQGAKVTVVARDQAALAAVEQRLGVAVIPADITDKGAAQRIVADIRPEVLVLNAGATPRMGPLDQLSWADFTAPWETDVKAGLYWMQAALHLPLAPGARVLVGSSGAAQQGSPLSGGYAGAKRMLCSCQVRQ